MRPAIKRDLWRAVMQATGVSRDVAKLCTNAVLGEIGDRLSHGQSVRLNGFGVFELRMRKARVVRAPGMEEVQTPAHNVIWFEPGVPLKQAVIRTPLVASRRQVKEQRHNQQHHDREAE